MIELTGSWAENVLLKQRKLTEGTSKYLFFKRMFFTSINPFIALKREIVKETSGEVLGFSLVYSGNFFVPK